MYTHPLHSTYIVIWYNYTMLSQQSRISCKWHICPRDLTQEWYMCRVSKYVEGTERSVAVFEADADASKKPITAKNTEVVFSVTFLTVMVSCWHPRVRLGNGYKSAAFCSRFRGGRGCQQETHYSAEHGGSLLRVLHRDGSLAGRSTVPPQKRLQTLHSVP